MAGFLFDAAAKAGHRGHDGACDDDFYDRLSRRYSVVLLVIFTILVSTKQYVGEPIACFCPAHFTGTHVEYTNNICWISNTFFVSFDRLLPKYPDPKTESFIYFYQYVPLILIVQAIFFYMPSMIWSSLNSKSGYDLGMLVTHARVIDTYTSEIREVSVRHLARHIDRTLEYHRQKRLEYMDQLRAMKCSSLPSIYSFFLLNDHIKMRDHHLMWSFLFTKILYLFNALGQLYLLNFFLGNDYHMYGFAVIRALFTGNNENWTVTPRFPRVTWYVFHLSLSKKQNLLELSISFRCNFAVRNLADNIHTYTVQCSLPINIFNEKIFLIVWFWLYLITLFTLFGFFYWLASLFYPQFYKSNLIRYLSSMKRINIHHFPENPFHEPAHHRSHSRHHHHSHHSHRRYSFTHSHATHQHHHNFLSSLTSRTMRANFDLTRLPRLRDQMSLAAATPSRENVATNIAETPEDHSPSLASTPLPPLAATRSSSFSINNEDDDRNVTEFLRNYLNHDGVLVLYLLQINTNEVITGEIVTALYELFKANHRPATVE